ncbi:hypothetical protein MASR2M78_00610 [Treponema sp.]
MAKRIHFEDDIFHLLARIRLYRDALELDLDPYLFLDKTFDDLEFLDRCLDKLLRSLLENDRLIERQSQLLNLSEAEELFSDLCTALQGGRGSLAASTLPFSQRFVEFRSCSLQRRAEIDGATSFAGNEENDPSVVSQLELNELLKGME